MKKHTLLLFILYFNIAFSQIKQNEQTIEIPVIFHIIDQEFESGSTKRDQKRVTQLINKINDGFNDVVLDSIAPEYRNMVANCNIKFKLAKHKLGLTWHITEKDTFTAQNKFFYDKDLKKHGYINSEKYLNIWICKLKRSKINVFFNGKGIVHGYSTFPNLFTTELNKKNDGVVLSNEVLYSQLQASVSVAIHEIGHWLGLEHISEQNTNKQNYMGNSNMYGMFTKGQAIKMRENIFKYRKGFLSKDTNTTNVAIYHNMTVENFNYYVISTNNLDYKNNDIYLKKFIQQIQKLNPKSEFDLKRMKVNAIKKIKNSIINLNTKYKKSNYVDFLRKYNFENKYFPFKVNIVLWDWQGSYQLKYFSELDKYQNFRLYAINSDDFDKIELSNKKAEKLINLTNQRRIYPQIEYSTLKIPVKNSKGKLVGMLAHIDHIKIFSDMHRTRLVHTIYAKTNKETYHKYSYAVWNDIVNKFQLY